MELVSGFAGAGLQLRGLLGRIVAAQGFNDRLGRCEQAGKLARRLVDGFSHEASGAIDAVEDFGKHAVNAGALLVDAFDDAVRGNLNIRSLPAEVVGHG